MKSLLARFLRVSPPMVVAMIALFVALTGTAVATTSALITGNQIKNSSITGADIKNKSLKPIDFSGSVRGPRGSAGPPGAQGPQGVQGLKGDKGDPGTPATKLWAAVNANGTLRVGQGVVSSADSGVGYFTVDFNQNVRNCAWAATISNFDNTIAKVGEVTTYAYDFEGAERVRVGTRNSAGTSVDLPFVVTVFC